MRIRLYTKDLAFIATLFDTDPSEPKAAFGEGVVAYFGDMWYRRTAGGTWEHAPEMTTDGGTLGMRLYREAVAREDAEHQARRGWRRTTRDH